MKKKRLDRDLWAFDKYPYYQLRVDMEEFHGLVCLIRLLGGVAHINDGQYQYWEFPKAGKAAVCGKGMSWLQLIPDGKSHVLTAMYLPGNSVSVWYADVVENIEFDTDGVAVFVDKYIDVIFTPQGDMKIDDREELNTALQTGEITKEQYDLALKECDLIIKEYCSDIEKTEVLCSKILSFVNNRIDNGERPFKEQAR